jgi:acyl-CoA synthetase (AMP-forming)/AMP-acid ligase II
METSRAAVLSWLDRATSDRGIHFAQSNGSWQLQSYERLAQLCRELAWALIDLGLCPDDIVHIVEPTGPEFIAAFFGTLWAGGTPSPIAPPLAFQSSELYDAHFRGVLQQTSARFILGDEKSAAELGALAGGSRVLTVPQLLERANGRTLASRNAPARYALVQFTSGSSGGAKGVCLTYRALEANLEAIDRWLEPTAQDVMCTWLPLHHDMGLIGAMLWPISTGRELRMMRPEQFVRRPLMYLNAFHEHRATLAAIPPFGLDYIVRRVPKTAIAGFDLRHWRGIVIGAERIEPATLQSFYEHVAPAGFPREALLPAYGLAETTLAATAVPRGRGWKALTVERTSLSLGARVVRAAAGSSDAVHTLVGCGVPVHGARVSIIDATDRPVPDGVVGEIVVEGASVADGYLAHGAASQATQTNIEAGRLRTGDAGFVSDGELYVLGRIGDSLKVRGKVIFAEDLESALFDLGVSRQHMAVLTGIHHGAATVVAVLELAPDERMDEITQRLRQCSEGAQIAVLRVAKGTILRTSSGKPKRRRMWQLYTAGEMHSELPRSA